MLGIAATGFEWVRALVPLAAAFVAVIGAAVLTRRYEEHQKQREFDRETMRELASLYGQIFATWKAWDSSCEFPEVRPADGASWQLLTQASDAEGRLEALLIRLAADRSLSDPDIKALAALRTSFKMVRKAIREDIPLEWRSGSTLEYGALKSFAASTAALVAAERTGPVPSPTVASDVYMKMTSDKYEPTQAELAAAAGWPAPPPTDTQQG